MKELTQMPELLLLGLDEPIKQQLQQTLASHGHATTVIAPDDEKCHINCGVIVLTFDSDTELARENLQQLMKKFRRRPYVIALFEDSYQKRCQAYEIGADECVQLPIIEAELVARIQGCLKRQQEQTICPKEGNIDALLLSQVAPYLMERIGEDIKLRQLELKFGVNRNKLENVFKDAFGVPVFAWLREQRMKAAAHLFITTDKSINQIAYAVGYKDSNNFSTSFKQVYGRSPLRYRKLMRQSKIVVPHAEEFSATSTRIKMTSAAIPSRH